MRTSIPRLGRSPVPTGQVEGSLSVNTFTGRPTLRPTLVSAVNDTASIPTVTTEFGEDGGDYGGATRLNPFSPFSAKDRARGFAHGDDILYREEDRGPHKGADGGQAGSDSPRPGYRPSAPVPNPPGGRVGLSEVVGMMRGTPRMDDGSTDVEAGGASQHKVEGMYVIEGLKRLSKTARVAVMHRNAQAKGVTPFTPPVGRETQGPTEAGEREEQEETDASPGRQGTDDLRGPAMGVKTPPAASKLAHVVKPRLVNDMESGSARGATPHSRQRKRSAAPAETEGRSASDKLRRATNKLATNARLLDRAAGRRRGQDGALRVMNRRVDVDVMRSNDFLTTLRSEYSYSVWKDRYANLELEVDPVQLAGAKGGPRQQRRPSCAQDSLSTAGTRLGQARSPAHAPGGSSKPRSKSSSHALGASAPWVSVDLPQHIIPKPQHLDDTLRIVTDPTASVRWPGRQWDELGLANKRLAEYKQVHVQDCPLTPRFLYLHACEALGLRPEATLLKVMQGVRRDGAARLQNYRLGDTHIKALAAAIGHLDLKLVNLADNRLTHVGLGALLPKLQSNVVQKLNLSHNSFDHRAVSLLATFLDASPTLLWLSIENTCLGDAEFATLASSLCRLRPEPRSSEMINQSSLRHLNASRNYLSDRSMAGLARLLTEPSQLRDVDVSWNSIRASGLGLLAPAVSASTSLASLDLSWNRIGSPEGLSGVALGSALKDNRFLTHLDIGFSGLSADDCQALSVALRPNRTLLGLHVSGNPWGMDGCGYVLGRRPVDDSSRTGHILTRILASVFQKVRGREVWAFRSRCWVCEHWREETFVFDPRRYFYYASKTQKDKAKEAMAKTAKASVPPKGAVSTTGAVSPKGVGAPKGVGSPKGRAPSHSLSSDSDSGSGSGSESESDEEDEALAFDDVQQVVFHASFDDWTPEAMEKARDGTFVLHRMAPPGPSYFYFTVDGGDVALKRTTGLRQGARDRPVVKLPAALRAEINATADTPAELHVCHASRERDGDSAGVTLRPQHCHPRDRHEPVEGFWCSDGKWRLQRTTFNRKAQVAWSFQNSLFTHFKNDTEARMRAAFKADYAHTRLESKLGKWPDDLEAAKSVLEGNYYMIKNVFRHYAAAYSAETFNLSSGGFNEFIGKCAILDPEGKGCDRVEVDTQFITVNMSGPKHPYNPKRALTRAQFMEILTTMAISKFVKTGICAKPSQAIQRLISEFVEPRAERDDPLWFRRHVLYKEGVDVLLRDYEVKLRRVYLKYSGLENVPGEDKTMSVNEWTIMVEQANIMDEFLVDRAVRLAYVRAKETEIDELNDHKAHRQMSFTEFLEGLVRMAYVGWCAESAFRLELQRQQLMGGGPQGPQGSDLGPSPSPEDLPLSSLSALLKHIVWLLDPHKPLQDDVLEADSGRRASLEASRRYSGVLATPRRGSGAGERRPSGSYLPALDALGDSRTMLSGSVSAVALDVSATPI